MKTISSEQQRNRDKLIYKLGQRNKYYRYVYEKKFPDPLCKKREPWEKMIIAEFKI